MGLKERDFQKICQIYLAQLSKLIPIKHWRIGVEKKNYGKGTISNGLKGFPDLLVCYRGLFCGIELKALGNKVSDGQLQMETKIRNAQGHYSVCYTLDQLCACLVKIAQTHLEFDVAQRDQQSIQATQEKICNRRQIKNLLRQLQTSETEVESDNAEECDTQKLPQKAVGKKGTLSRKANRQKTHQLAPQAMEIWCAET
jgi:hypothetical protein